MLIVKPYLGKGNGRGISGFAVNLSVVNRGITVHDDDVEFYT